MKPKNKMRDAMKKKEDLSLDGRFRYRPPSATARIDDTADLNGVGAWVPTKPFTDEEINRAIERIHAA